MVSLMPVTLLLPVRNGEKFLGNCLDQIESMARECDEILFVNDGSSDKTLEILNSWKTTKCDFRVISTTGIGLVQVLNLGVKESCREWVARVDVDDFYDQDRINIQSALIKDGVVAIFSDYKMVSNSNHSLGRVPSGLTPSIVKLSLVSSSRTPHPVVLFRRETFFLAGGYLSNEYPAEDLGLWMRMSQYGEVISSSKNLLRYRLNPKSITLNDRANSVSAREFLVGQFKLSEHDLNSLGSEISFAVSVYRKEAATYRRIFLLYRDLYIYRRLHPDQIPWKLFFRREVISISFVLAGIWLAFEKLLRFIYRGLNR